MSTQLSARSLSLVPLQGIVAAESHDPRREIRFGSALVGLFVVGFLGWSAIAHLDSAVHSPGVVKVAGNRQSVQSMPGGVVSALHVRDGDHVKAGQILIEFASTEVLAQERSLASRVFGLQAEIARIDAERGGIGSIARPVEWQSLSDGDRILADHAMASEQNNLNAERTLLASERAVLQQRIAQVGDQIQGYDKRQQANNRQGELNEDELGGVQDLYKQGFATRTRVLALQRNAASIQGDVGATAAEVARLKTSAGETRLQIMQLSDQRAQENAERLRTAQTELQTLLPQWKAARDQLELTRVRAPVSGTVLSLTANTVGGVAAPGQKLMEIVPTEGKLIIEAQIAPSDANDLHPGQPAEIHLSSLRGRHPEPLHGTIERVSADSLMDERTGRTYYTANVAVRRKQLDEISRQAGIGGSVRPGTPVEVIVPLQSRTALQYWIGPLTERLSPALSER
jgi:HlyD family secretion protein